MIKGGKQRMSKILLTGGNGYIGSYLAKHLRMNHEVMITSRRPHHPNERLLELLNDESFEGVCSGCDTVIHTANMDERLIKSNSKNALLINAFATRQLFLDAIENHVKTFLYFSTFHVYGKSSGRITETTLPEPISDYALTHLFAEQYLKQLSRNTQINVICIRLTNGIGYPENQNDKWYLLMNDCCKNAVEKSVIKLNSDGFAVRDFVSINDVCNAVDCLLQSHRESKFEVYNISSQSAVSILQVAELVKKCYFDLAGIDVDIERPNTPTAVQRHIESDLFVSSEKIRRLGWHPQETLETTICDILTRLMAKR